MPKKLLNRIVVISSVLIVFLFILHIQANDVTTFGIKQSEIPRFYMKFFVENEKGENDYIQWQIGAFLIDKTILNENNIFNGIGKNDRTEEFEQKFNKYKEIKRKMKKKKNMKYGWEEVRQIFSELISDEFLEEQIMGYLKYYEFEDEKWKNIKEIENWTEIGKEEQNGIIEENLKLLIKKLHQNEMEKLLVNSEVDKKGLKKYNESELSKSIQQMNNESNNKNISPEEMERMEEEKRHKFESMKMMMRKMVGDDWTFVNLEENEPILMRYDIIEPTELFRIYKIILSGSTIVKNQQKYLDRVTMALIFGEIWKLRKTKFGIRESLNKMWHYYLSIGEKPTEVIMLEKWLELTGFVNNGHEYLNYMKKKFEYAKKIRKMDQEQLIKIYAKEEEEFKKFLDENMGARARILRLFGEETNKEIEETFIEGNELTEILWIVPNEEKIEQMFLANYLEAFQTKNEISREKATMRIYILIGVEYLDKAFGRADDNVFKLEWNERYRPMFFFYLDQTVDSTDWKICEKDGIIYLNMLFKLRKFMMEEKWKNEDWNLYLLLQKDFMRLNGSFTGELPKMMESFEFLLEASRNIIQKLRKKFPELDAAISEHQFEDEEEMFHFLDSGVRKSKASLSSSPEIQSYFSWNSNFVETYEKFILEKEIMEMESLKENVDLDAILWHYKNIFDNLFESMKDLSNWQIDAIKRNWEENLKNYKGVNYLMKRRKLCKLQYFFQDSLAKNEEIKNLDEWKDFMELPTIENIADRHCDDDRSADTFSLQIVGKQKIKIKKKVYFDYLNWLITYSGEFRQFLTELDETFKYNLINILNVEEKRGGPEKYELFEKLEKMHPKLLRIDEMNMNMRMELYKTILKTKEYLHESMNSQRRIAMATMLGEIKKAQKATEKCGLGIEYPEKFEKIKMKIDNLLEEIYEKRGENFDSMENICILTQFRQFLEIKTEYIGDELVYCLEYNGKENLIEEYKSDLCKEEDEQIEAWENQKEILGEQHKELIMENGDNGEIRKLIEKFGGMVRTWLLVPKSMKSELLAMKNFSMDSVLREHFLEALYAQNKEDRIANKMAVNFFSWARYIDKKLDKLMNSKTVRTNPTILERIWLKKKNQFDLINKYDALGNVNLSKLISYKTLIARFHLDILELIEKAEKEIFTKQAFENIFDQILEQWENEENEKEWEENKEKKFGEYLKRIQEFNTKELMEQFNIPIILLMREEKAEIKYFRKKIFEGLKNKEATEIFVQLIGMEGIKILGKFEPKKDEKEKSKEMEIKNVSSNSKNPSVEYQDESVESNGQHQIGPNPSNIVSKFQNNKQLAKEGKMHGKIGGQAKEKGEKQKAEIKFKKINGDSIGPSNKFIEEKETIEEKIRKENERKMVEERRKRNQKNRQIKKERKLRKIAQREENWRILVKEKAKANKITMEEEMKQINEHLSIEELVKLLKSKGYGEFPNPDVNEENEKRRMASRKKYLNQSEFVILEMMEILAKWNKESRMLISGSMELKLNTADSDIDFIVILPYEPNKNWANEFEINYMGNSKSKCFGKKCENGDEISLYCFLCQEEKVISIQKIDSHIPQIKMRSTRNIPIDINMALVPKELIGHFPTIDQQLKNLEKYKKMKEKMEEIMKNQPNLAQIDELIRNIIIGIGKEIKEKIKTKNEKGERIGNLKEIEKDLKNVIGSEEIVGANELLQNKNDKRDGMILALSGYRANKQIVDLLLNKENYRNFQIAILALKLWTKNNFIYNGLFGFLNGATLSVLVCKLAMELGENASALKLLEQFFHKYHKRGNEMLEEIHLEFKKNDKNIRKILDWSKGREIAARHGNELGWQVITAGFPTQNAAFQIIPPTRRIINAELANGLEKVGKIRELIEMAGEPPTNLIHEKLTNLFATQKFEDKYSNFVGIICKYPPKSANGPAFCGFLEAKLRLKLPLIDAPQIDYCHIKPERIINKRICPEQFGRKNEEKLCTIWLAGIKLKDDINVENVELEAAINWKESSKQLITKTKEEFYKQLSEEDGKNDKEEDKFDAIFSYFSKEDLFKWIPKTKN